MVESHFNWLSGGSKCISVIWSSYLDVYQINIQSITATSMLTHNSVPKCWYSGNNLGHVNGTETILNFWYELCFWRVLCVHPVRLCQRPSGQCDFLPCAKVMCDVALMSFHFSFHIKAFCVLAQCDEVWISFPPMSHSNLPQCVSSLWTTYPGCSLLG